MPRQIRSPSKSPNRDLKELARRRGEGNVAWGVRAAKEMVGGGDGDWSYVALVGGRDLSAFRVRVAQSHMRHDLLPSYWSECLLVELDPTDVGASSVHHVPLAQPGGPSFPTGHNGVLRVPLTDFDDARRFPNIALIALPVPQEKVLAQVARFAASRASFDALEHVLRWLAFVWGSARTGNPLFDGVGLPSACLLESVAAACQFDLTPGLEARAACPEAIWTAARHWQSYYAKTGDGRVPHGRFVRDHGYDILEP